MGTLVFESFGINGINYHGLSICSPASEVFFCRVSKISTVALVEPLKCPSQNGFNKAINPMTCGLASGGLRYLNGDEVYTETSLHGEVGISPSVE